jgi:hypothetical protein
MLTVLRYVTPCRLQQLSWYFGDSCYIHHQSWNVCIFLPEQTVSHPVRHVYSLYLTYAFQKRSWVIYRSNESRSVWFDLCLTVHRQCRQCNIAKPTRCNKLTVFIDLQDQLNMCHIAALLTANPPLQQDTVPHAVICSLTQLKMGNSLSKTCWDDLGDQ